jgi:hypothetical protein
MRHSREHDVANRFLAIQISSEQRSSGLKRSEMPSDAQRPLAQATFIGVRVAAVGG